MSDSLQAMEVAMRRTNQRLDQIEAMFQRNKKPQQDLQRGLQRVNDLKTSIEETLGQAEKFKTVAKTASTLAKLQSILESARVDEERLAEIEAKLVKLQDTVDFFAQKVSAL